MATLRHFLAAFLTVFTILVLFTGYYHDDSKAVLSIADLEQAQDSITTKASLDVTRTAWKKFSIAASQAIETVNNKVEEADVSRACERIKARSTDIQSAIGHFNVTEIEDWVCNATVTGLEEALKGLEDIDIEHLPADVVEYVEDHPLDIALYVIETAIILSPGGLYIPFLRLLGFTRLGVRARSIAAFLQSRIGARVPARSWFAHLVSGAMGGYGRWVLNRWTSLGVKLASWLQFLHGRGGG